MHVCLSLAKDERIIASMLIYLLLIFFPLRLRSDCLLAAFATFTWTVSIFYIRYNPGSAAGIFFSSTARRIFCDPLYTAPAIARYWSCLTWKWWAGNRNSQL